jgi:hypothetical protein
MSENTTLGPDPVTRRAESIREITGMAWEYACRIAEEERDACATLGVDFERFCDPDTGTRLSRTDAIAMTDRQVMALAAFFP